MIYNNVLCVILYSVTFRDKKEKRKRKIYNIYTYLHTFNLFYQTIKALFVSLVCFTPCGYLYEKKLLTKIVETTAVDR